MDSGLRAVLTSVQQRPDRIQEIVASAPTALIAFDRTRRIEQANAAAEQFFGYPAGGLAGLSVDVLVPERLRQPDAPPMVATADVVQVDLPGRMRDGRELLVEWRYSALERSDGPVFLMEVRDRAELDRAQLELTESEERFRLLVDAVTDHALYLLDPAGRVSSWNAGAARIKGWSEKEIVGQHYEVFFTPEDRVTGLPHQYLAVAEKTGVSEATGWRLRKDGSRFWASVRLTALRGRDGRLRGFAKITRDLTERLRAEETERRLLSERARREAAQQAELLVRASEERLSRLQKITAALSQAATPEQVAEVVLGESLAALGASAGAIYALGPQQQTLRLVGQRGHPAERTEGFQSLDLQIRSPLTDAARERTPLFFDDREACAAKYPELRDAISAGGFEASAALPLVAHGRLMGSLGIRFGTRGAFRDVVKALVITVSDLCGQALERAELFAAEQAARRDAAAQRDQLERYFLHTPTPLAVFEGASHQIAMTNPPYRALFGNRRLDGLPLREAIPEIEPTGIFDLLDRTYQTGERIELSEFLAPLPGENGALAERWFNVSIEPVRSAAGKVTGIVTAGFEVTAQVHARRSVEASRAAAEAANRVAEAARQRLLALVDQMPLGVILVDWPSGEVQIANPQVEALLRQPVGKDLLKTPWRGFRPDGTTYGDWEWPLARALMKGETVVSEELEILLHDDSRIWLSVSAAPVRDATGSITAGLLILQDTTERKRDEEALRTARAEAEAASRGKDEFLALLGHELRNPLAPITTAIQLLKLRGAAGDREHEIIERQVTHLSRLVDDLLDVARITQGKTELRRRPVELAEVVERSIETASPLLEQRRHALHVEVPSSGLSVLGDSLRLGQVVSNLLTNAAKYTPPGGRIHVGAAREGADVVLRVKDNGVGIQPELLPSLFKPFVQAPRTLDRSEGGLGLGLALIKNLVALHGGTVSVASEGMGKGSEFTVRLIACDALADVKAAQPAQRHPATADAARPTSVLVVDDNVDAAELLAEALRMRGHEVSVANDGPSALGVLSKVRPTVALIDLGLPVMDGFELARRIQGLPGPAIRLVAVTGYGQESDRARSAAAGFQLHLTKPVELGDVIAAVEEQRLPGAARE